MRRLLQKNIMPLAASCLALLMLGSAAQAQDPARLGRTIMKGFCARCHSIAKRGESPQPGAPPFRTLGRSFELDQFAQDLQRGFLSGHPDMPEFKFSADDARAVVAFLRTIQR
jgi:cytochrome c